MMGSGIAPIEGQEDPGLVNAVERAARLWNDGQSDSPSLMAETQGVRMTLLGDDLGLLERRQATAALSRFLEPLEGQSISVAERRTVGSAPATAYAELAWAAIRPGIPELQSFTVFLGFRRPIGEEWRLTEIRVLP